jgi:hypothetical protein
MTSKSKVARYAGTAERIFSLLQIHYSSATMFMQLSL